MPLLSKADLQYKYSWNAIAPDDPLITGNIDGRFLNRGEGYEVLYFINALAAKSGWTAKVPGLKTERLINDHLPGSVRGRNHVHQWLVANWKSFD